MRGDAPRLTASEANITRFMLSIDVTDCGGAWPEFYCFVHSSLSLHVPETPLFARIASQNRSVEEFLRPL